MASPKKRVAKKKKATKKRVARTPRVRHDSNEYVARLSFNDQTFLGRGKTAEDAFKALSVPRAVIKTKIMLTLTQGERKFEEQIYVLQMRRALYGTAARGIWAKRWEARMK